MEQQERKLHRLAALEHGLLGEEGEVRFDEEDDAVEGPVGAPKLSVFGAVLLESVEGEADGDEEGEGEVNEAGQHGFNLL